MNENTGAFDVKSATAAQLSFVGDAVYSLMVRQRLTERGLSHSGELHSAAAEQVSAVAQAAAYKRIEPLLTEIETAVYKRGRNAHNNNTPKSATNGQYHSATGVECLFGYLYLSGQTQRLEALFDIIIK